MFEKKGSRARSICEGCKEKGGDGYQENKERKKNASLYGGVQGNSLNQKRGVRGGRRLFSFKKGKRA